MFVTRKALLLSQCRLLCLLIFDTVDSVIVENIDLQRFSVLLVRYAKLILPLGGEYRRSADFRFGTFFDNPLVNLR